MQNGFKQTFWKTTLITFVIATIVSGYVMLQNTNDKIDGLTASFDLRIEKTDSNVQIIKERIKTLKIEIQALEAHGCYNDEMVSEIDALYEYILEVDKDVKHMWDVIE